MTEDADDIRATRRNLATAKFNYIAWAFRNCGRVKMGATDLMVLAQLTVRFDPERGAFAMSAEALARRTGTAISSVRRSLRRLERLRDIEVISRPGRSNLYKVRLERAPSDWIARERKHYEIKVKRSGLALLSDSLPKSGTGATKMLQGGVSKSGQSPRQNLSAVSIPSSHSYPHISSSMRPDGRKKEDAVAFEGKKATAPSGGSDPFNRFIEAWPRPDRDTTKLRGAWHKRVIKPGYDPEDVISSALEWRRYYLSDPDGMCAPFAGQWLAREGWLEQPPPLTSEGGWWANYREALAEAAKRLDARTEPSDDTSDVFDDD